MKWVVVVVRTLVGLGFAATSVMYFAKLVPEPEKKPPVTPLEMFGEALWASGYMDVVKAVELVGGLLLVSGRMAPLGITLLMPVAVNILLFEVILARSFGPGAVLVALLAFLVWGYRAYFGPVFTASARL